MKSLRTITMSPGRQAYTPVILSAAKDLAVKQRWWCAEILRANALRMTKKSLRMTMKKGSRMMVKKGPG
jgi:hypothetical protein